MDSQSDFATFAHVGCTEIAEGRGQCPRSKITPLRYELTNELHARPFPSLEAPATAAYLAIKHEQDAAKRDRAADIAHLIALLDRYGATHPQPGATHYFGKIGRHHLKWESHTEFVTYTVFTDGAARARLIRQISTFSRKTGWPTHRATGSPRR